MSLERAPGQPVITPSVQMRVMSLCPKRKNKGCPRRQHAEGEPVGISVRNFLTLLKVSLGTLQAPKNIKGI